MQGGILGIQAKEATNNTQPTHKKPAIKGRRERGRRPKHPNHTEEERRGAGRQQRTDGESNTYVPEGVRTCLSGVQKGAKDHTKMNTSVREHTAPQQYRKHGVEETWSLSSQ